MFRCLILRTGRVLGFLPCKQGARKLKCTPPVLPFADFSKVEIKHLPAGVVSGRELEALPRPTLTIWIGAGTLGQNIPKYMNYFTSFSVHTSIQRPMPRFLDCLFSVCTSTVEELESTYLPIYIHGVSWRLSPRFQSNRLDQVCPCHHQVVDRAQPPPGLMASSSRFSHDYTEGASAEDIRDAMTINKPSRRDSRYSSYGEDHFGNIFDGPGTTAIPSSVSRMSQDDSRRRSMEFSRTRRSSYERRSIDSRRSGIQRADSVRTVDSDAASRDDLISLDNRSQGRSSSPPVRPSVFENIANIFGRSTAESPVQTRRPSLSRGSTSSRRLRRTHSRTSSDYAIDDAASEDERWGYSSGEDDEEAEQDSIGAEIDREGGSDMDSYPPTPTNLPLLLSDPIFGGETRIDLGVEFEPLEPPPPGPPSRQTMYVSDEDVNIRFVGYEVLRSRQALWRIGCVLSFGILALLGHWFPRAWLRWVAREKAFVHIEHGFVVVEV